MKDTYRYIAFDLGAESGRAVVATLENGKIDLAEMHRFRTEGMIMLGTRQWDLARIYEEMEEGLRKCAAEFGGSFDGIAIDTWGVDFGLLAADGSILGNPVQYRDKRTEGMQDYAFSMVPKEDVYKATGIQFLPFNTVYQLLSLVKRDAPVLKAADKLLMVGDLLGYLFSGVQACEYTNASTTQMLDPWKRTWNEDLIGKLGIPRDLLPELVEPGTVLGPILPDVAARTGIDPKTPIITPGTHDTASAVVAVPVAEGTTNWAYMSSGTWSLLGAELDEPFVTDESLAQDFTNEGGVGGKIRFLKNIIGLWLMQEVRRGYIRQGYEGSYDDITAEGMAAPAFASRLDVDDPRLIAPDNMLETIKDVCRDLGEKVPETRGEIVRCVLEGLALRYRRAVRGIDEMLGQKTDTLHIVGGGTKSPELCQMTADACNIKVVTGPVEATTLGNVAVQAMSTGAIGSMQEARDIIANSFDLKTYTPQNPEAWDAFDAR